MPLRYYTPTDANHTATNSTVNVRTRTNTWQMQNAAGGWVGPKLGRNIRLQMQDAVPAQIVVGRVDLVVENPARDDQYPVGNINLAAHPTIAQQNDINFRQAYNQRKFIGFGWFLSIYINSATACVGANNIAMMPVWEN